MTDQQRTLIAIVLMALILLVFFSEPYQKMVNPARQETPGPALEQSIGSEAVAADSITVPVREPVSASISPPDGITPEELPETHLRINTNLFELELSSLGGGTLEKAYLHDYLLPDSSRVQLIADGASGVLSNQFIGFEVESFSTAQLPSSCSVGDGGDYSLTVYRKSVDVVFSLPLGDGASIIRTFTFYPDSFHFDLKQELIGLDAVNAGRYFATSWTGGVKPTEANRKDDLYYTKLYALLGDDTSPTDFDAKDERETSISTGQTSWVGVRSKYFAALLIPDHPVFEFKSSSYLEKGEESFKVFDFDVRDSFARRNAVGHSNYRVYVGPLDYDVLKTYGLHLEEMMNWGWFGIIGKGALRLFKWLYSYIPNYGLVLIIFSILVKLVTSPLTRKQFASTQRMQQVQPQVAALKEKFKDDPKRLNEETMKLYKEMGVNPLGGCMPLLIQMPILIAMFNLFRTTIELRGAAFGGLEWWIADLSLPDTVGHLFGFPVNPLPILMAATMILQQKLMSPSSATTNPQMKNMPYIMTVVFLFMFYRFPSGLNLYYTLFNIMSIIQQKMLPHKPVKVKPAATVTAGKKKRK